MCIDSVCECLVVVSVLVWDRVDSVVMKVWCMLMMRVWWVRFSLLVVLLCRVMVFMILDCVVLLVNSGMVSVVLMVEVLFWCGKMLVIELLLLEWV